MTHSTPMRHVLLCLAAVAAFAAFNVVQFATDAPTSSADMPVVVAAR